MKGKDLLMIGGLGLALYLVIPKGKAEAAGGITILPSAPTAAGPDIGGIFSGIASLFGAMPQPIVPEINIPEFILPPIVIPEVPGLPDFPDWSEFFPDWESFLPDLPDELKLPDIPSLIPDIPGIPDLIPDLFGGNGNGGLFEGVIDAPKATIEEGVKTWINFWDTATDVIAWGNRPWYKLFTDPLWLEKGEEEELEAYRAESEAIFEEAGVSEATPGNIDLLIAAREKVTGETAEALPAIGSEAYMLRMLGSPQPYSKYTPVEKYPGYSADIELLKKHPYFGTIL